MLSCSVHVILAKTQTNYENAQGVSINNLVKIRIWWDFSPEVCFCRFPY